MIMNKITVYFSLLLVAQTITFTYCQAQPVTVQFRAWDKVIVTADLYAPKPATAPFIILYHQATYSRGEYAEIAPKLNKMGFNCLAADLRSGEAVNGITNETWKYCDSLGFETRFTDAYSDVRAAVSYVKNKYPGAKIILFGSSYSASLSLKFASDFPSGISGVVAFSPAEYFSKYGWSRTIITTSAAKIKCSVFIASNAKEKERWQGIYDAIPGQNKSYYIPTSGGKHGAKTLWSTFPESTAYWNALKGYLVRYTK
jgi:dienelactone hydrolase